MPLRREPVVEGRLVDAEPFEQLAPVQRGRFPERLAPALSGPAHEGGDVHVHRVLPQSDQLAVRDERVRRDRLPQGEEGLAEVVAGVLVGGARPEKAGQRIP